MNYSNDLLANLNIYQQSTNIKWAELARRVGVSKSYFNKVRYKKIRITYELGKKLEQIINEQETKCQE